MTLHFVLLFCIIGALEGRTPTRSSCNGDVIPCHNRGSNISVYLFNNTKTEGGTSELPSIRRIRARPHRPKKRAQSRKHPNRRRVSRRKIHRHSTRVFTLKPAVILLPPYENITENDAGKLDPFIINVIGNDSTPATVNLDSEQVESTTTLQPPNQFLLPPVEEVRSNSVEIVTYDNARERSYPTTASYEGVSFVQQFNTSTSVNPFEKLEKEFNDIQRIVEAEPLVDARYNQTFNQYANRTTQYNRVPTPAYNETFTDGYYTDFEDGSSEEVSLENDYTGTNRNNNIYKTYNNTLLAPDVASLGMKIVTSKKGVEMVKELSNASNPRSRSRSRYRSDTVKLETAETGDFRLQNYDNQILAIEDAKEVPKEAVRVLKGTHKPFQLCNGSQGYVADHASGCQIFYICLGRGAGEPMMCPNGTLFNQDFLVCDWWYNVECPSR